MTYVLDTHALVWFIEGNSRLSSRVGKALIATTAHIVIPSIVLVEIKYLHSAKRIKTNLSKIYNDVLSSANCVVHPLDEEVVNHIPENLNIHDAIIAATALVYRDVLGQSVKLVTKDRMIKNSKLIEVLW